MVNKITLIEAECEHAAIDPITEAQRIGALINATEKDRRYHDAVNEILMKSDEYAIYEDVKAHLLKQEIVFNQRDNRNREHHYHHRGRNMNLVGGEAMRPSASHGPGEAKDKSQVICPFHSTRGCLKGADCDMKHVGPSGGNKAKRRQTSTNKTGQWKGASGSRGTRRRQQKTWKQPTEDVEMALMQEVMHLRIAAEAEGAAAEEEADYI